MLHTEEATKSQSKVLEELRRFYCDTCSKLNSKMIIVQGNTEKFWYVLQKQKIDFRERNVNIFLPGKQPDAGGLYYKFLTLYMRNFSSNPVVYGYKIMCFSKSHRWSACQKLIFS